MIVVLDASGAIEIASRTQDGVDMMNLILSAKKVMAPDLYVSEVSNVLWKIGRAASGRDKGEYFEMARDCIDFIDEYVSSEELWVDALREAFAAKHPAYDMLYAVLAGRNDAVLATMDKELQKACRKLDVRTYNTLTRKA
jgi:predicted nucleic acid-binding protein